MADLVIRLTAKDEASPTLRNIGEAASHMGESLLRIGEIAAGIFTERIFEKGVEGLKSVIEETMAYKEQVEKLQLVTGASAQEASGLLAANQLLGGNYEQLTATLTKFTANLGKVAETEDGVSQAGKTNAQILESIGVSVSDAEGKTRPFVDILNDLADQFQQIPDPIQKTALAVQLFGKGGASVLKTLEEGSEGLRRYAEEAARLGVILSDQDQNALEAFERGTSGLNTAIQGIKNSIMIGLAPALTYLAQAFMEAVGGAANAARSDAFQNWALMIAADCVAVAQSLVGLFQTFASFFGSLLNLILSIGAAIHAAMMMLSPFFRGSPSLVDEVTDGVGIIIDTFGTLDEVGPVFDNLSGKMDKLKGSLGDLVTAVKGKLADLKSELSSVQQAIREWVSGPLTGEKDLSAEMLTTQQQLNQLEQARAKRAAEHVGDVTEIALAQQRLKDTQALYPEDKKDADMWRRKIDLIQSGYDNAIKFTAEEQKQFDQAKATLELQRAKQDSFRLQHQGLQQLADSQQKEHTVAESIQGVMEGLQRSTDLTEIIKRDEAALKQLEQAYKDVGAAADAQNAAAGKGGAGGKGGGGFTPAAVGMAAPDLGKLFNPEEFQARFKEATEKANQDMAGFRTGVDSIAGSLKTATADLDTISSRMLKWSADMETASTSNQNFAQRVTTLFASIGPAIQEGISQIDLNAYVAGFNIGEALANKLRTFTWGTLWSDIGEEFKSGGALSVTNFITGLVGLPLALTNIAGGAAASFGIGFVTGLAEWVNPIYVLAGNLMSAIGTAASNAWNLLITNVSTHYGPDLLAAWTTHLGMLETLWQNVWLSIQSFVQTVFTYIGQIFSTFGTVLNDEALLIWKGLKATWDTNLQAIALMMSTFQTNFLNAWDGFWAAVGTFVFTHWEDIKTTVRNAVNAVIGFLRDLVRRWNSLSFQVPVIEVPIPAQLGGGSVKFGGQAFSFPPIPEPQLLARGGKVLPNFPAVVGELGPELWWPSTAGRIIPSIGSLGAVNVTVNVMGSILTEDEVARSIQNTLIKLGRNTTGIGLP